ncbi:MAG: DNA adenine methylase [Salinibacterium sp.]|nr:DNA adenine methylase [Salinibacterium sp.]
MTAVNIHSKLRLGNHSPLRYPGGKSKLAGFFADVILEAGMQDVTYVEPFAGGAGAGLALLASGLVDRVVINDLDPAVHSFWSSVRNEPVEFARRIESVPLTLSEWDRQRQIYKSADGRDPLKLGFAFFYLNRTNRSGVLHAGVIGGKSQSGTYKMDARFNRGELARRIRAIGSQADQIELTYDDGRKCVEKWAPMRGTFLYVDPPYVVAGGSLYLNAFDDRDHAILARTMNERASDRWLLTYDDAPLVRDLYRERPIFEFELHYSAHRVGKARELLIASDAFAGLIGSRGTRE